MTIQSFIGFHCVRYWNKFGYVLSVFSVLCSDLIQYDRTMLRSLLERGSRPVRSGLVLNFLIIPNVNWSPIDCTLKVSFFQQIRFIFSCYCSILNDSFWWTDQLTMKPTLLFRFFPIHIHIIDAGFPVNGIGNDTFRMWETFHFELVCVFVWLFCIIYFMLTVCCSSLEFVVRGGSQSSICITTHTHVSEYECLSISIWLTLEFAFTLSIHQNWALHSIL